MKVYIVGHDAGVSRFFVDRGHDVLNIQNPVEAAEALPNPDLVVFTGGEDVWPVLYGAKNEASHCNPRRDITEMIWFHRFYFTPKLGICRGGQFLNVMSGGSMIQDRPYHALADLHLAREFISDNIYRVTSTHHQEMKHGQTGIILASGHDMPDGVPSTEVVWYQNTQSLCFQPHPEYQVDNERNMTIKLLQKVMAYCYGKELKI